MDIKGLLKLTSAGYSLTEIKEMTDRETVLELVSGGIDRADIPEYIEVLKSQEKPKEKSKEKPKEKSKEKPEEKEEEDYKAKYEQLLKEKQERERQKPLPDGGERTAEKILEDFAKNLK